MFERESRGQRALLVHPQLSSADGTESLQEFIDLAESAGVEICAVVTTRKRQPDARYFIGSGKAEEVAEAVAADEADVVLVNHELAPVQERNLEGLVRCRVLDRTTLILDIFAQRALSHEGKLQVELAQLRHLSTRLVRGWTHLERQKGGIGLRGPGETQLETDRRLLAGRVKYLTARLSKVSRRREQSRRARRRSEIPTVALVGYTNAGKSTLFNQLTDASVLVEDKLFATLDPTLRRLDLPGGTSAVLADTVGFVRRLPHELIAAFKATLQETRDADLLLHVVDSGDEQRREKMDQVVEVLDQIDAGTIPRLNVRNKIDMSGAEPFIERDEKGMPTAVRVSAATGAGLDLLGIALAERLSGVMVTRQLCIPVTQGKLRAQLFEMKVVREEGCDDAGNWLLTVEMPQSQFDRMEIS